MQSPVPSQSAAEGFRNACLRIVLEPSYQERLRGVEACAKFAPSTSEEECLVSLDKRAQIKETWPGVGALMHAMEDEFPQIRIAAIKALGEVARVHPRLRNQCVKTILDGLQDSEREARVQAVRTALSCKPKHFQASELRLLLETLTSDDSMEVKEEIMRVFVSGPSFAETVHAAATAEWLASLQVCSDVYLFRFGRVHASLLYHCQEALVNCTKSYRVGVFMILAGVSSIWGELLIRSPEVSSQCKLIQEEMLQRKAFILEAEHAINRALQRGSLEGQTMWRIKSAKVFVEDMLAINGDRSNALLYWSGLEQQSLNSLMMWTASNRSSPCPEVLLDKDDQDGWEDSLPPRKTSFEISYVKESQVSNAVPFGIARIRVNVRARFLRRDVRPMLLVGEGDESRSYHLIERERTERFTAFAPVTVASPYRGTEGADAPTLSVTLMSLFS